MIVETKWRQFRQLYWSDIRHRFKIAVHSLILILDEDLIKKGEFIMGEGLCNSISNTCSLLHNRVNKLYFI